MHYGFSSNTSESTTEEQESILNYEIGMNVGFEGFGVNESLSETYRQRVEQTVSNAYTYSFSVDYTTECTVKKGTEGVGLFQ